MSQKQLEEIQESLRQSLTAQARNEERFNELEEFARRIYDRLDRLSQEAPPGNNQQNQQNNRRVAQYDLDYRVLRSAKTEAPSFDGCLDPIVFTDWIREIDDYFDWYDFSVGRKYDLLK